MFGKQTRGCLIMVYMLVWLCEKIENLQLMTHKLLCSDRLSGLTCLAVFSSTARQNMKKMYSPTIAATGPEEPPKTC